MKGKVTNMGMKASNKIATFFKYFVLILVGIIMIYPLLWMISATFKDNSEIFAGISLWIKKPTLDGYRNALNNFGGSINILQAMLNTYSYVLPKVICTVVSACIAAYGFGRFDFPGRKLLFTLIVCAMALPKQVILIPLLREMSALNLYNTIWAVIFPIVGWPFGVFLMKQFSEGIPTEMLEAARIDGASEARTFVKIVLPMVKPGIGALAIFTFINSWNDYFMQLIMLSSTSNLTISLGIAKLQAENSTDFGLIMAGAALAAVPIIIIFLIFQKYFTKGIAMGAVKG
jgi:multiple sugar transport system permease protein